ncbi:hypothetical protein pb186bvf_020849 [Paramecium bursaria]
MNILRYESEADIPQELRCIFCNGIDKDQRQFNDFSFMYCPTCLDSFYCKYEYDICFLTYLMQIKCDNCGKYKHKIDHQWHHQKCIQLQQSHIMSYYEQYINFYEQVIQQYFNLSKLILQSINRILAYNHQLKCEWRLLDCPYKYLCQWRGTKQSLKLHSQKCIKQQSKIDKEISSVQKTSNETRFDSEIIKKEFKLLKREISYLNLKFINLKDLKKIIHQQYQYMNQYNLPSLSGSESQSSIQKTFERYNQQDRTSNLWFQESDQKPLDLSFQDPQPTKKNSPQQVLFNFSNEKEEIIDFQPLIPLKSQEQKIDKTILKQNNYVTPPKVQSFQPFQDSRQDREGIKQINEQNDKKPKYVILETKIKTTERKNLICQAPQPNYIILDFSKGKAKVTSQSTIQVHLSLRDLLQK